MSIHRSMHAQIPTPNRGWWQGRRSSFLEPWASGRLLSTKRGFANANAPDANILPSTSQSRTKLPLPQAQIQDLWKVKIEVSIQRKMGHSSVSIRNKGTGEHRRRYVLHKQQELRPGDTHKSLVSNATCDSHAQHCYKVSKHKSAQSGCLAHVASRESSPENSCGKQPRVARPTSLLPL